MDDFEDDVSLSHTFDQAFTLLFNTDYDVCKNDVIIPQNLERFHEPGPKKDKNVYTLINCFKTLAMGIEKLHIFSSNETISDIQTDNLKYLSIPFVLGVLCCSVLEMQDRVHKLKEAMIYFQAFLTTCEMKEIGRKVDFDAWKREEPLNVSQNRDEKLQRATYRKNLINLIKRNLKLENKWESLSLLDEETVRSTYLNLLDSYITEAVDQIGMITKELPLLEKYTGVCDHERTNGTHNENNTPRRQPWAFKVNTPMEAREIYSKMVFQPGYNLPTVSLAEFAEMEMKKVKQQSNKTKNSKSTSSCSSDEDSLEVYKARQWDDWKDENPRGIGNKNRNVG